MFARVTLNTIFKGFFIYYGQQYKCISYQKHSLPLWSLPRISWCFLVTNAVTQHFLACLCKVKRISQGAFLGYDIPNRLWHVSTEKLEWCAAFFNRQIHYTPENIKNILFNVTSKKIYKIWSVKQFNRINHVHSLWVWLYLDYLFCKDHYPWYKTVTY